MFEMSVLATFVAACFLFSIIPGPSVTAVMAQSLANGTRAGFLVILGTEISMLSMVFVVALGLQAVVQFVGEAFFWIKLIGAAYLIWLGIQMVRSSGSLRIDAAKAPPSDMSLIIQGALINCTNPKTLLFLGAFLPQFIDPTGSTFAQTMALGLIVMAVASFTDAVYALLAGKARAALSAARLRILNRVSGIILIGAGLWLASQQKA